LKQTLRIVFGVMMATAGFAQTAPVPSQYQGLNNSLSSQISTFDSAVRSNWDGSRSGVIYAPQLETANSGVFTGILIPYYYQTSVLPELDELQALGAQGVKIQVDFPVLYQPFYSAAPSLYQLFANFYQQVAKDIRARGMKVIVESMVENQFPGDNAGAFTAYYTTLSWGQYMAARAAAAVNTAQLMQPDYMSLITEPDSEAGWTGQNNVATVAGATQLLQTILTAFQTAGITGVSLGAGTGSWQIGSSQYIANFVAMPIQYVDVHVYPLNEAFLMNTLSMASIAQAAGKPVAISQLWDFKLSDSEFGVVSLTQASGRDPFSFWAPIDTAFLQALSDYANYEHALFIAPFWSQYFFAYLDYGTYGILPTGPLLLTETAAAGVAKESGSFTSTGQAWLQLSLSTPDTIAPARIAAPAAEGNFATTAQLIWAASTDNVGVAGYHILRNGQMVGTTSLQGYSDLGLTPGTTYQYTITAFDASGNTSLPSPTLAYRTTTSATPSVPTQLTATTVTLSQITLTWNVPASPHGISSYEIFKGLTSNSLSAYAGSATNSYTDTAVAPGVTFYYAVLAIDNLGNYSPLSAPLSITDPQEAPPSTPGRPTVYSETYNQVVLTWPASTSSLGVSGYLIFRGATPTSLTQIGNTTLPFFGDGAVTPSATYYYAVTAYDLEGLFSSRSAAGSAVVTPQEPPPTAPGNLAANAITYNQVAVSWTASTSGSGLGGYTVYRGSSPSSLTSIGSAASTATTYTDGTTQPSTTYYYAVAAYDAYGLYGPSSSSVSVTTPQKPPPAAPTVVSYSVLWGSESYNAIGTTRNRLPWQIAGIQVVFSEPIASGTVNSLSGVTTTGFSGLGTNTLTWTISPIAIGNFATTLAGSGANALKDSAGNVLANGAGFSQNLKILYGDFNDDGVVNSQDLTLVNAARTAAYNIFADVNGDGVVNATDVQIVRTREGTSLP
jgi:fibronectin type 3 domain-containing protein